MVLFQEAETFLNSYFRGRFFPVAQRSFLLKEETTSLPKIQDADPFSAGVDQSLLSMSFSLFYFIETFLGGRPGPLPD